MENETIDDSTQTTPLALKLLLLIEANENRGLEELLYDSRDLHQLLDTLDTQLTKPGKNVVHLSKLFTLKVLIQVVFAKKHCLFVTHHKNLC